jgi:hypothetical protein
MAGQNGKLIAKFIGYSHSGLGNDAYRAGNPSRRSAKRGLYLHKKDAIELIGLTVSLKTGKCRMRKLITTPENNA